jgi:hypothetical protein
MVPEGVGVSHAIKTSNLQQQANSNENNLGYPLLCAIICANLSWALPFLCVVVLLLLAADSGILAGCVKKHCHPA